MRFQFLFYLACVFSISFQKNELKKVETNPLNVLIIGNSYVYFNDMPDQLNQLFIANNHQVNVAQIAYPGYYLMAHLTENQHYSEEDHSETIEMIQSKKWDVIILQESTFFLLNEITRKQTVEAIQAIQSINNNEDTKFYFFQTWTSKLDYPYEVCFPARLLFIEDAHPMEKICSYTFQNQEEFHQALIEKTATTAKETQIGIIPFGEIYHEIWKNHPNLNLLEDEMHPSKLGAFINAWVIYHQLTQKKSVNTQVFLTPKELEEIDEIISKYK